ncbi:sigma-70 family RNA polymerase sigma factor [Azospirillum sp. TSO35-2]|uniref:sigma-70 family RNA polymerase sigma factor n=1 Tax=Azospirillum sp. TSO35-2 TaxID=716796 RepID=UPI000D61488E|nr:sigma-70 family RNA polymerase sigma factor [Azospirillum sp. TSO35-2]PWC39018.1 RNA polymerase subunit sigma [Azospirillum sp. TSO35-2]
MIASLASVLSPTADPDPGGARAPGTEPAADLAAGLAADLVAVAAAGDRAAFARLFAHFAPRVKAYMLKLGMPAQKAEDLAQDTLLTVWRKASLYDPARAEPASWVFTIARNLRIDALRRERHPEVSDDELLEHEDERPRADDLLDGDRRARRLRGALATLTPEQAEVVRLSFFADLAHPAIAERLDVPLGTVKSRLRLAMAKIRKALGDDDR